MHSIHLLYLIQFPYLHHIVHRHTIIFSFLSPKHNDLCFPYLKPLSSQNISSKSFPTLTPSFISSYNSLIFSFNCYSTLLTLSALPNFYLSNRLIYGVTIPFSLKIHKRLYYLPPSFFPNSYLTNNLKHILSSVPISFLGPFDCAVQLQFS